MKSQAFTLWTLPTKQDVIRLIASRYNSSNRSMGTDSHGQLACRDRGDGGKECAFAFVCAPGVVLQEEVGASSAMAAYEEEHGISPLQYRFSHITHLGFWGRVQNLHDNESYWDGMGLTGYGRDQLEHLLEEFKD